MRDLASPAVVRLREVDTIHQAVARVRAETIGELSTYFYVADSDDRLVGVAPVRQLLLEDPATLVGEIMVHPVVSVRESEVFGSALALLAEHRLLAIPVVDEAGRLTGVIDVSAATRALVDLERRETAAGVFQTVGARPERPFHSMLTILAIGLILSMVVTVFHGVLERTSAVAFFIPSVVVAAGVTAIQAISASVEGLRLTRRKRQARWDGRGGILWAAVAGPVVAGLLVSAWLKSVPLGIVVACSLMIACAAGTLLGYAIPRLVHRWEIDPKMASGPLVSALAAIIALTCYLAVSSLVL